MLYIIANLTLIALSILAFYLDIFLSLGVIASSQILMCCTAISCLFFLLKYRNRRFFCFELLFFSTFIIATYIYPAFLYQQITHPMFRNIDDFIVIKTLIISTTSILCYNIGGALFRIPKGQPERCSIDFKSKFDINRLSTTVNIATSVLIALFLCFGGYSMLNTYSTGFTHSYATAICFQFAKICLFISVVAELARLSRISINTFKTFIYNLNLHFVLNIFIVLTFLLLSGDRGAFLEILLPAIILYHILIKKISSKKIVTMIALILLVSIAIKEIRADNYYCNDPHNFNVVNYIEDFLPATATSYIIVEHSDNFGYSYGKQLLPKLLAIIPFAQSAMSLLFDLDFYSTDYVSSLIVATEFVYSDLRSGLGTHLTADAYYTFGWLGAILVFLMFGLANSHIDKTIFFSKKSSFWYILIYAYVFGISIYMVRAEIGYPFQNLSFTIIVTWLLMLISPSKKSRRNATLLCDNNIK